tara:strand:- start:6268 stop:6915 length:648 start_codon:yes stop_codon:yes gene_type:complete
MSKNYYFNPKKYTEGIERNKNYMSKLIGVSGFARSGKDTFFERSKLLLEKHGKKAVRVAFADALKSECDELLSKYTNLSAFTEEDSEKEIVRPLLVTYGTQIRRKLNENCWIEKVQPQVIEYLKSDYYVFVTDVRFKNEAKWINMNGGILVNISREGIKPANHEEHRQLHLMKGMINYDLYWPTYGSNDIAACDEHVFPLFNHLLKPEEKFEEVL